MIKSSSLNEVHNVIDGIHCDYWLPDVTEPNNVSNGMDRGTLIHFTLFYINVHLTSNLT